jgi:glycosyltransferase involved in cell wall biosynthesis
MTKVAMIVTNACCPDPRVERHAKWLSQLNCQVTIHAFDRTQEHSLSESVESVRIMRYHIGNYPYGATISTHFGIKKFQRMVSSSLLRDPPDLVYCHDADTISIGQKLSKKCSIPFVFDMHDLHHTWITMNHPRSRTRKIISNIQKNRMLKHAKKAKFVITSSGQYPQGSHPGLQQWLETHGIQSEVIENRPVSIDSHPMKLDNSQLTIGYLGRIRETTPFKFLLNAIKSLPAEQRPNLRLAGDGVSQEAVYAMVETAQSNGECEATLSGSFKTKDMKTLMGEIDVMFAMYSPTRENIRLGALPTKMFDAAMYGKPSIVNAGCLMADVVEQESLGIAVEFGNIPALVQAFGDAQSIQPILHRNGHHEQEKFIIMMKKILSMT